MDSKTQVPKADEGHAASGTGSCVLLFNTMIAVDAALLSLWLADRLSTWHMFVMHMIGAVLLLGVVALLDRKSILGAVIEASLCILAGPLGTIVLQLTRLGQGQVATNPDHLDALSDLQNESSKPVSPSDAIHAMHVQGRRSTLRQDDSQSYADMLRNGDLLRHNEVIGAISRNYEPEMYPALSMALGSSSPALKVQAAAVFSKLRRTLGEEANELLQIDQTQLMPDEALEHHRRLLRVAQSGFVDAAKMQALIARAEAIAGMGMLVGARPRQTKLTAQPSGYFRTDLRKQGPRLKRYSCGGLG